MGELGAAIAALSGTGAAPLVPGGPAAELRARFIRGQAQESVEIFLLYRLKGRLAIYPKCVKWNVFG